MDGRGGHLGQHVGLTAVTVESTDGRNKLPGFVGHLKERQKSAFGRFGAAGVWVVSYVQGKQASSTTMDVRIATDLTTIPHCTLQPKQIAPQAVTKPQQPPAVAAAVLLNIKLYFALLLLNAGKADVGIRGREYLASEN